MRQKMYHFRSPARLVKMFGLYLSRVLYWESVVDGGILNANQIFLKSCGFFLNKINLQKQFIVVLFCLAGKNQAANVSQRIKTQLYFIMMMVLVVARQQPKNVLEGSATARLFTFRN